jgi:hypothetical protein
MTTQQRTIKTVYRFQGEETKVTTACNPNRAVAKCVEHLQVNDYGATVAEVYDRESGVLHAIVKRSINGSINIAYRYNPEDFKPMRLSLGALLEEKK